MPRKPTPTVMEAVDQYMRGRHHLATTSAMNDRSVLRRFAETVGADRRIGYLTVRNVEDYFIEVSENQKPTSYNKVLQRVRLFLTWARRQGWVTDDLTADVRARRVPQIERLRLSSHELVQLLEVPTDPRERAFLATAMNTALRSSEIRNVRVKDLDLDLGELYIFRSKSGHDDRLPLTPTLERELRVWLTTYTKMVGQLDGEMYLFPARHSPRMTTRKDDRGIQVQVLGELRPWNELQHAHRVVQRALRAFGVTTTTQEGLHTVRRSVARAFFEDSADRGYDVALRATATLLGHKSTQTTEIYLGLSHDRRRRDAIMRGQDFLPFDRGANVVPLRATEG